MFYYYFNVILLLILEDLFVTIFGQLITQQQFLNFLYFACFTNSLSVCFVLLVVVNILQIKN